MLRRHVLVALDAGLAAGDVDAARVAIRHGEWLVRGIVRRRLETALLDAAIVTREVEYSRHVMAVAALASAGVRLDNLERSRVVEAYRSLPKRSRPRVPLATLGALIALALVTVAVVHAWPHPVRAPKPPPVAGAYVGGGVPATDVAIEEVLVGELTQLVVATDVERKRRGVDRGRIRHVAALRDARELVNRSDGLARAWRDMITVLDRWVYIPASSHSIQEIARTLRARVRAVSDQFAALGLGYYLEGDVYPTDQGAHAVIYSYRVEEVSFVLADGKPRRVLALRRLDHLNIEHALLGMQSLELGDPILLLDQIDEHVATRVLPLLAPGAPFPLFDDALQRSEIGVLATAAGANARRELATALGADAAAAATIGALLVERGKLIERWRRTLERRGLSLPRVEEIFLPEGTFTRVSGVVPELERLRAAEIEIALKDLDAARIATRCHHLVAATVRRHEAQHGLDEERDEPLRYPMALHDAIGPLDDTSGRPRRFAERARNELSAYASQIANDPITPQLSVWSLARQAFDRDQWGSPESYVAAIAIETIARRVDGRVHEPVVHDRDIDRRRLAPLAALVAVAPDAVLRKAAAEAWKELFGEPLVPIVDR